MSAAAPALAVRARLGMMVIPLLALAIFINYVDRGNLATAGPLIKDEFALSATAFGQLVAAFSWTYVAAMPLAGWASERIGAYRTMAIGLAIWSLATLLTGFASGFAMLFALRLALGVGESVAFPCSSKIIAEHVPPARLGLVNSLMTQGVSFGPAFGIFFGGILMGAFGWRQVFLLFGALSLLWLVPWIAATRRHSRDYHAARPTAARPLSFWAILRRRELWGLTLAHVSGNYGFYFVITWMPLYLVKVRGFTMAEMATLGGFVYLAYAAAAFVGGLVTDRWIERGATHGLARKTVAAIAHLTGAAGLLISAFAGPRVSLAGLFVTGIGLGLVSPHIFATAQRLAGQRAIGKWIGVQNCLGNLSGIVGPIVTGWIIDTTGGYQGGFALSAAVTLAGLVGWLVIIPRVEPLSWDDPASPAQP
jgi:MFS family permease